MRPATAAVHAGQPNDPLTGAITVPIYQTTTFAQEAPGVTKGYSYSRTENPSRAALEASLAALEGARHGLAFASGLSAVNTVLNLFPSGTHIVAGRDLYGGSYRIFTKLYQKKYGFSFDFVETTDPAAIRRAIRKETRCLWLESPSNPLLTITDLAGACALARERGILSVVDNTFASPVLQSPLALGADVALHSTTKYINGHADVLGGALCVDRDDLFEELRFFQNAVGAVPSPHDCFLVMRGIKTLPLRMEKHCANAREVASALAKHPRVRAVHFPGLETHPGHAVAKRQMRDFGAMVSFEIEGGGGAARAFCSRTRLFTLAESLGGVKSLLSQPATMTHASVEPEVRAAHGITDSLIRLSVGIEDPQDLVEDLDQALRAASA